MPASTRDARVSRLAKPIAHLLRREPARKDRMGCPNGTRRQTAMSASMQIRHEVLLSSERQAARSARIGRDSGRLGGFAGRRDDGANGGGTLRHLPLSRGEGPVSRLDRARGPHLDRGAVRRSWRLTALLPLLQSGVDYVQLARCLAKREPPSFTERPQAYRGGAHPEVIATSLPQGKSFGCGSGRYQLSEGPCRPR